ncbi:Arabinan endo-1,5-alpha-L-arabinosidase [Ascochyta rabiei]|uniref:Arabinan endo-1,5-alpha-L-arabinosidase n=1 Tax=Didymella rabiei TaxID=5454 RepID=A0A163DNP4_DIDRA|nr:Arabinan endo-1,5-alpha-L-arabinosidase [Ascochyta rabiei]KZM23277.1 arabinan endo-1,5-alpha-L-arabinosidase [Ascochyta rabiei]UPX13947.1 Arabinan endo-1,5-alpha-L-arabinosidase [Ascochyta rabiei]
MKSALAVSAALSVLSATADAYTNPLSCSGTCTNAHDPSLVRRDDGTYYRFSTGGKVAVHTAPSIQGPWTYKGAALPNGSKINKAGNQDLWAPDVIKVGSKYYLYYSVSAFGGQDSAVGVATSTTMDVGSWTDLGSTGVESVAGSKFNAIDGNLQSANGKLYMNFGSFWSDLFQIEMTATPTKVAKAVTAATQVALVPTSPQAQEAAFGYQYGNYYYLFFSVGSCCGFDTSRPAAGKEYKIQVCRSSSVSGPFVDKSGKSCLQGGGTTVLESHGWVYGPGGQGILSDTSLGPVIYYHYVDTRIGYADGQKQFGVNKLDFSSGWPVV